MTDAQTPGTRGWWYRIDRTDRKELDMLTWGSDPRENVSAVDVASRATTGARSERPDYAGPVLARVWPRGAEHFTGHVPADAVRFEYCAVLPGAPFVCSVCGHPATDDDPFMIHQGTTIHTGHTLDPGCYLYGIRGDCDCGALGTGRPCGLDCASRFPQAIDPGFLPAAGAPCGCDADGTACFDHAVEFLAE